MPGSQPTFEPVNPEFAGAVRESFAGQGLLTRIGARLAEIEAGRVAIELPHSPAITQQQGLFHGAAIGAIGDSAGGYASLTLMPAGSEVMTIEYKINFVRPARGALLRAVGQVLRAGRSVTTARIDVMVTADGRQELCALLQASFMRVPT